jgi:ribonuclease E
MVKRMLIDALHAEETRVVIADEQQIYDFDFVTTAKQQMKGNIYLAKITRVEPSLQAAFVEYGGGKQGFLPFAEIHTDYYQIPISDRKRLLEEAAAEIEAEDEAEASTPATEAAEEAANDAAPSLDNDGNTADEAARPAYLMQSAIDVSISEDAPAPADELAIPAQEALLAALPPAAVPIENDASLAETATAEFSADAADSEATTENNDNGAQAEESVETLASEEDEMQTRPKRNPLLRRYKIQEVIRRGQIVLVQVIKEERGNKGCSLTTYLSLAGRYCVLMPNSPKDGGISRKIASAEDRKRLKALSAELRLAEGMSVIIRTAGMDRTRAEIKRDFDYLVKLWNAVREDTLQSTAPALIYEESDIIKRAIRDQYTSDIDELTIEGEQAFHSAREFMKLLLPSHVSKIKQYNAPTPLFYAYNIEDQLLSMHDPVVKLKSGGYIVINPTEALISIDVNSGRATGERNIEETALKTNMEAAAEVARQLRLRDLAGLVVIDFIDMVESRNRRSVEKMLKDSLKMDRAKIQLGRISPFGLLEMSRQRLRPSIAETSMVQCPHCVGRGLIRSNESMSIQVIRAIEKEASSGNLSIVRVHAPQTIAIYILNNKREALRALEERYGVSIQITISFELTSSDFTLEKVRRSNADRDRNDNRRGGRSARDRDRSDRPRNVDIATSEIPPLDETADIEEQEQGEAPAADAAGERPERTRSRRRRGGRGGRDRDRSDRSERQSQPTDKVTDVTSGGDNVIQLHANDDGEAPEAATDGSTEPRSNRRSRGGRGRRKWRDRNEQGNEGVPSAGNAEDAPTRWDGGAAALAAEAATNLPAFATESRIPSEPAPPTYKPFHDHRPAETAQANTDAEKSAASKRGWWQKMISLDD